MFGSSRSHSYLYTIRLKIKVMLKRGRPAQVIEVKPEITTQVYDKGDGIKQIWTWNKSKNPYAPISVETIYPKSFKSPITENEEDKPKTKRQYVAPSGKLVGYTRAKALGII
jgi:hypothetical protein